MFTNLFESFRNGIYKLVYSIIAFLSYNTSKCKDSSNMIIPAYDNSMNNDATSLVEIQLMNLENMKQQLLNQKSQLQHKMTEFKQIRHDVAHSIYCIHRDKGDKKQLEALHDQRDSYDNEIRMTKNQIDMLMMQCQMIDFKINEFRTCIVNNMMHMMCNIIDKRTSKKCIKQMIMEQMIMNQNSLDHSRQANRPLAIQ